MVREFGSLGGKFTLHASGLGSFKDKNFLLSFCTESTQKSFPALEYETNQYFSSVFICIVLANFKDTVVWH
jgi:hypothetical protein